MLLLFSIWPIIDGYRWRRRWRVVICLIIVCLIHLRFYSKWQSDRFDLDQWNTFIEISLCWRGKLLQEIMREHNGDTTRQTFFDKLNRFIDGGVGIVHCCARQLKANDAIMNEHERCLRREFTLLVREKVVSTSVLDWSMVNDDSDCSCSLARGSDFIIHSLSFRTPCSFGAKHTREKNFIDTSDRSTLTDIRWSSEECVSMFLVHPCRCHWDVLQSLRDPVWCLDHCCSFYLNSSPWLNSIWPELRASTIVI